MEDEKKDTKAAYMRAMKDLSEDDRPREKALKYGIDSLTPSELLAIIIGSGTVGESVVDLSQRMLKWNDNKLANLARRTVGDLKRNFKGVGDAKAITILAAMRLARLYAEEVNSDKSRNEVITNSEKAYSLMRYEIGHLPHEEFWVVALNNAKRVITKFRVSQGGLNATVADSKIIMKMALDSYASCIILYHNHPSGNPQPSANDDAITNKIYQAGKFLDIPVIDHIIVCENRYFSYADEGRL